MVPEVCPKTRISTIKTRTWRLKKKKRFLAYLNTNISKRKNERKKNKNKNKNKRTRWWLSNGGGSTSRCRDTGGDTTGLPTMMALVLPCLSSLWCHGPSFLFFPSISR